LETRELEPFGRLGKSVAEAVLGEKIGDVEIGKLEKRPQALLELMPVEPAQRHAAVGLNVGSVGDV